MFRSINKAVALVLQSSFTQGRLWKVALESQGFKVIWRSPDIDILNSIEIFKPEVALIDISKGTFNPFEISRQSAKQYPSASIIFTNHKRQQIYPSERQWAIRQKAADLISAPKTFEALRAAVASIVDISGTPIAFNSKALANGIVFQLQSQKAAETPQQPENAAAFFSMQPLSDAFSPIADIIRDIAALPDAGATAKCSLDQPKTPMFRGRAIAPSSTVATPEQPARERERPKALDDRNSSTFDNPFPHLFYTPEGV